MKFTAALALIAPLISSSTIGDNVIIKKAKCDLNDGKIFFVSDPWDPLKFRSVMVRLGKNELHKFAQFDSDVEQCKGSYIDGTSFTA